MRLFLFLKKELHKMPTLGFFYVFGVFFFFLVVLGFFGFFFFLPSWMYVFCLSNKKEKSSKKKNEFTLTTKRVCSQAGPRFPLAASSWNLARLRPPFIATPTEFLIRLPGLWPHPPDMHTRKHLWEHFFFGGGVLGEDLLHVCVRASERVCTRCTFYKLPSVVTFLSPLFLVPRSFFFSCCCCYLDTDEN